jgi:hypothetical protein
MKFSFGRFVVCCAVVGAIMGWPARAVAGDDDAKVLKQAQDLVHQAWAPDADTPPPDDKRLAWLEQAADLAKKAPQHHVHGHRVKALELIHEAEAQIKNGDPDKKVGSILHDADAELRESISESD